MLKFISAFALILPLLILSSCGNMNRVPRYNVGEPLQIETFKRRTAHPTRDFVFTFKKTAYRKVKNPLSNRLSPSQVSVLERHGQPDYIREGFRSLSGETVDEWLYWDRQILTQFVQRELVWEGPVTEMDEWRLKHGYPRQAWSQSYETGVRRDIWDYRGFFLDTKGMVVTFSNENLATLQEY